MDDYEVQKGENQHISTEQGALLNQAQGAPPLEAANALLNEELHNFKHGTQKGELHLGKPLACLMAAGVQAKEITITPKVLKEHLGKHGLAPDDLKGLAKAIQEPLVVYEWGKKLPSTVIVTELTIQDGRKIAIAIRLAKNGSRLNVNEVATVHGKTNSRLLEDFLKSTPEELGGEKLKWVEHKKVLDWLGLVPPKGTASLTNPALNSIAKVVKEFENPNTL
ncbi:MAG: hypothetical protein LBS63_01480 [Prevotellaceae bacterium]|jgi:hypothetical protein|nr:hypothetical protein [Prevotellaceae bacterium]